MTKEELISKAAEYAAVFSAPVFIPSGTTSTGKVSDDAVVSSAGQITEPGRYLVFNTDSSVNEGKDAKSNSIRWDALSEDGTPVSIYGGTLTKGPALKHAAKAGLIGTYGQQKKALLNRFLVVKTIKRSELNANNRRDILELEYTVED